LFKLLAVYQPLKRLSSANQRNRAHPREPKTTRNDYKKTFWRDKNAAFLLRAYPNNPLYCGRLQGPMPALSAKNVLNVEKTTPPSIFGLPPWPRTFRSAS